MDIIELLKLIIYLLVVPAEFTFNWVFGFVPDLLKIMCTSMLVVSIGKYLKYYERKTYMIIKGLLYIWFLIYLAYVLDYFDITKTEGYDFFEWTLLIISIVTPLCVLVVWLIGKHWLAGKLPFDVYYIAMVVYFFIGLGWRLLYPEELDFTVFFVYWFFLVAVFNYIFSLLCKGVLDRKDEDFWRRVFIIIQVVSFTVLVAILEVIILSWNPEEKLSLEAWWFGLAGIGFFGFLSIIYFRSEFKKYLVLLMIGSESLLFVDIADFLAIFGTALGIIIFIIIVFVIALILYFYTKRAKAVGLALLIAIAFSIAFISVVEFNNELFIENWAIGLSFGTIFIVLYLLPPGKLLTIVKRIHLTLIIFFLSLFLVDFSDYFITIQTIYF